MTIAMTSITIDLIDYRSNDAPLHKEHDFKVDSLKNSTMFVAGHFITEDQVQERICNKWTVNIRQYRNGD